MRVAKLALPAPNFNADPLVCLPLNVEWLPVLMSAVARLELKASWADGTDIERADQEILGLTLAIKNAMECGDMPFDVRQNPAAPCQLQKTDDGATWATWANLRLCPPLMRIGATGQPEISTDDGATYTPVQYAPPAPRGTPPAGQDNRCLAAANAVNVLTAFHYDVCRNYQPAIPLLALAAAVASALLAFIGLWIAAATLGTMIEALLLYASALTNETFTTAVQDDLRCILYCNADEDAAGAVTFDYAGVFSDVSANFGFADIWNVIGIYLTIIQESGLNLAGATTAITSADCSGCDCYECLPVVTFGKPECYTLGTHSAGFEPTTLDTAFGNPAPCAKGGRRNIAPTGTGARVTIAVGKRISQASCQIYYSVTNNPGNVLQRTIVILGEAGQTLAYFSSSAGGFAQNTWNTISATYSGSEICASVLVTCSVVGDGYGLVGDCWIDNVSIVEA